MLLEIDGDLPCYSDTLRVTSEGWRSELVLLSMSGPRNAVRAAWATLAKTNGRKKYRESISVGNTHVVMGQGVGYSVAHAPLERGLLHSVIFHPMLGHNAPDVGFFYQVGPSAERRYFARLARWCPIPLRTTWSDSLWDIGRRCGAIVEVTGHGLSVWHVATTQAVWEPIVRDALVAGELH
jgi:hypothetical protein